MLKLQDTPINKRQLNKELLALNLPRFTGMARLSREVDDRGHAILEDGAVRRVAPYIMVKCGGLTAAQKTAATKTVANHVPVIEPPPDPRFETDAKAIESAISLDELTVALARLTRAL